MTTPSTPPETIDKQTATKANDSKTTTPNSKFRAVFLSTFVTILLAEMGDKTQLATLLITAQSHSPWVVFIGAALALISTTLIGVMLGSWLAKKLSPQTLDIAAAILLMCVSVLLLWDVVHY